MGERRMFSQKITESGSFLEMPLSSQALYFHMCMGADDDGFVKNPKFIARMIGASDDDYKLLAVKNFVIPYESGVIVIKHWRMHNLLRKDRYHETEYIEEKSMLFVKPNGAYTLDSSQGEPVILADKKALATKWQPNGNQMATEDKLSKDKLSKDKLSKDKLSIEERIPSDDGLLPFEPTPDEQDNVREVEDPVHEVKAPKKQPKKKYGEYQNVLLTDKEVDKLKELYGSEQADEAITFLDEYIERKGYKAKSHYLTIRNWVMDAVEERKHKLRGAPPGNSNSIFAGVDAWLATKQISDGF